MAPTRGQGMQDTRGRPSSPNAVSSPPRPEHALLTNRVLKRTLHDISFCDLFVLSIYFVVVMAVFA